MDVTALSETLPTTTTQTEAATTTGADEISAEFTQFLELLTAQVENQDPFTPLDSTQFVEQLATFSALEQQVRSNELLESILAAVR